MKLNEAMKKSKDGKAVRTDSVWGEVVREKHGFVVSKPDPFKSIDIDEQDKKTDWQPYTTPAPLTLNISVDQIRPKEKVKEPKSHDKPKGKRARLSRGNKR